MILGKKFSKYKLIPDLVIVLLLFGITSFIYSFLLTIHPLSLVGDAQRYNGYQAYIVKYSLSHFGQFALWDQFLSSGISWISNPGGGQFSPTAWIVTTLFRDPMFGSRMIFFIHTFTASIAFYFLCRVLDLKKITSFFIAIVAICNQYIFMFVANGWFEEFFGLTLIPLTVGLLWLALTRRNYIYAVFGGLAMSLNFFSNSYYVFHYNVIVILWVELVFLIRELFILFEQKKQWTNLIRYVFSNVIFWVVLIGISAIKLLPLSEFRDISARNFLPLSIVETPDGVMSFSFFNSLFRDFIIPAGHTNSFTHWANDLALFFLFISVIYFFFKRSFTYALFLGLFIIGIWGYFAYRVPVDLYALVYRFLPGFNSNNFPYRFMIIIYFAFLVCVALGIDVLIRRKNKILSLLDVFLGAILVVGTAWYTTISYNALLYPQTIDIKNDLRKTLFTVQKPLDFSLPPKKNGTTSENLLTDLVKIVKIYKPEGRVYSTFSNNNALIHSIILEGEIPTVQHSYASTVPTYEYGIVIRGSTQDSLDFTKKRFKIFSVLDTRFQFQQKENFEYEGCSELALPKNTENTADNEAKKQKEGVCDYLEARLTPIVTRKEGGIYYDSDVLSKVDIISYPILLISDNRFNDYSGFIAKQIMFHPDFNMQTTTVLSGGSSYLDDYDVDELNKFSFVLQVDPKIKDKKKTELALSQYEENGGKFVSLSSNWIYYENLHNRSGSIYTEKPAWSYSSEDEKILSNIFSSLKSEKENAISIKKFTPEDLLFQVKTSKDNQVLQYSDSFYPGWKATLDGKKTFVYMADGLVKGIVIPTKGTHIIHLFYAPDSLKKGAVISGSTLIFLVGIGTHTLLKRKKRKKS